MYAFIFPLFLSIVNASTTEEMISPYAPVQMYDVMAAPEFGPGAFKFGIYMMPGLTGPPEEPEIRMCLNHLNLPESHYTIYPVGTDNVTVKLEKERVPSVEISLEESLGLKQKTKRRKQHQRVTRKRAN